ncbi:MAG: serine--tRNA ligase [Candidatus Parcubacteria bacterium]|nr:serine--tRNA ligase [Candidatus Parcubacteria bacterium]
MLDIKYIHNSSNLLKQKLINKGSDPSLIDQVIKADDSRKELVSKIDDLRHSKSLLEDKIAKGQKEPADLEFLKKAKVTLKELEDKAALADEEFTKVMRLIPNPPLDTVPIDPTGKQIFVLREVGDKAKFDFKPQDYVALSEKLDLIDTERAAKTSGSRFGFIKNELALMEFALLQFVFQKLSKEGFIPLVAPVMLKPKLMEGMGYVERGGEEIYYLPKDDLYLVGTAEQMIGSMHSDEILDYNKLPLRYAAFSSCFRREAGSYGKDTKGILRVHQFDKIEMFVFSKPEEAVKEHEFLLRMEEELMQALKIPYRVLNICSGDLGDPAAAKFDIEAWLPGQNNGEGEYRETHSTSNCTDFQARRLNIRYRDPQNQDLHFVYTLNGTAFAIGRALIAIIENYQTVKGTVMVPEALQPFMGGIKEIVAKT